MTSSEFDYRSIPYGVTDFERIRSKGYYYVDKTNFIPSLEFDASFAFFLRPRRFGKSLLLSVLECYYDINKADRFDELFEGLYIHEHPTADRGKYLVLKFNFSAVNPDADDVQKSFNSVCLSDLKLFVESYASYLPQDTMEALMQEKTVDRAMDVVCKKAQLSGHHIYLLIDEYDNFANTLMSKNEGAYRTLTHGDGFFRFFFNCVKAFTTGTDSPVQRIFITGVSPLTLSDVTSGFNIALNLSMRAKYNDLVGLSEADVCRMLDYYREHTGVFRHTNEELLAFIKPWYNNYCFSRKALNKERMFNTDMVMYFMSHYTEDGVFPEDMVDKNVMSDYEKMQKIIRFEQTYGEKTQKMQNLLSKGEVRTLINSEFTISEMGSADNLYSLLYYMGFLSFSDEIRGLPVLSIPNEVMKIQYSQYLLSSYTNILGVKSTADEMLRLMDGLAWDGQWKPFFEFVASSLSEVSSVRDYVDGESFVKAFFLANIAMGRENCYYDFPSEKEYGKGYVDLVLSPRGQVKDLYLVELKYVKKESPESEIDKQFIQACEQLKQYSEGSDFRSEMARRGWRYHQIVVVMHAWEMVRCEMVGE